MAARADRRDVPMRGRPRSLFALLAVLLLLTLPRARAEDDLGSPGRGVNATLTATRADDEEALRALAERDGLDPWVVAHELMVRGEGRAAMRLARASTRADLAGLSTYLRLLERTSPSIAAWTQRNEAARLANAGQWYDLVTWLEEASPNLTEGTVPAVEMLYAQGIGLYRLDRYEDGADALWRGAQLAERMGWLREGIKLLKACRAASTHGHLWRRRLDAQESLLRLNGMLGDQHGLGEAVVNLGTVHASLGDFRRATELYERALGQHADVFSLDALAQIRCNASLAYLYIGDLAEAQALAARAADDARAAKNADEEAIAWQCLGEVLLEIGDVEAARRYYLQAQEHAEEVGDEVELAMCLGNLGHLELLHGDLDEAERLLEGALERFRLHAKAGLALRAEGNLAWLQARRGNRPEAVRRLLEVRRALEGGSDPQALYTVLDDIATLYREMGLTQRALGFRDQALAVARDQGSVSAEASSLTELAWLHVQREKYATALEKARKAVDLLDLAFDRLPPGQAALARDRTASAYDAGLAAAVGLDHADEALFFLEAGRAGALLVSLEGRDLIRRAHVSPELRADEDKARTDQALAHMEVLEAQKTGERLAMRAARKEMARTRDVLKTTIERSQLDAGRRADLLYPHPAERPEIQANLASSEALVLYGESREQVVAVVLTKETVALKRLGPVEPIAQACDAARIRPRRHGAPDPEPDFGTLIRLIVEPLELSETVTRVLVSPSGCLSYQPTSLLFPGREVAWVPSGTAYLRMRQDQPVPGERVLALGDPELRYVPAEAAGGPDPRVKTLPPSPASLALRGVTLGPLPEARGEARTVGDVVLVGAAASETGLRRVLTTQKRWRAVHFACHGLIDEARPSFSTLVLAPSETDDGLLSALDVYQMQIPADLVILSACDSGRGPLRRAEGIIGLTNSFISAGASSVIVSLWQVEDRASRKLMETFHELWNHPDEEQRLGAAAALKAAQDHVSKQPGWEHPRYWAAWQLWGRPD